MNAIIAINTPKILRRKILWSRMAQWLMSMTLKQGVIGSIPSTAPNFYTLGAGAVDDKDLTVSSD